jgi:hypothetical protein
MKRRLILVAVLSSTDEERKHSGFGGIKLILSNLKSNIFTVVE